MYDDAEADMSTMMETQQLNRAGVERPQGPCLPEAQACSAAKQKIQDHEI